MGIAELFFIAVGLSMDTFAISICIGLSMKKVSFEKALIGGLYFGFFQSAMPLAGYLIGARFADFIVSIDHWLAFILLAAIGGKMIFGSLKDEAPKGAEKEKGGITANTVMSPYKMIPLAVATSIDALAVGVSFAFLQVRIVPAISFIGIVTLIMSLLGVKIGSVFGAKLKSKAEFAGGLILVLMGLKILLEHLGIYFAA